MITLFIYFFDPRSEGCINGVTVMFKKKSIEPSTILNFRYLFIFRLCKYLEMTLVETDRNTNKTYNTSGYVFF